MVVDEREAYDRLVVDLHDYVARTIVITDLGI